MSWSQWPPTNVPQTGMVQPPIINPAPNVNTSAVSTSQYTPEQWAQMQHQNWQQWVQWQQQFQLWQQQYGAEYQKSMNAIAQAAVPAQPPTSFLNVPPPPTETKPPPPPEEPVTQPTPTTFSMSVPPPVAPSNYTTAPPPQIPNTNPSFEKFPPNRNNPPPVNTNTFPQYDNSQQKFNRNQNFSNRGPNMNWQNQNQNQSRNQPTFNRFTQPPPVRTENDNKFELGIKRPGINTPDIDNSKRNKVDTTDVSKPESNLPTRWGAEGQPSKNSTEWETSPPKNNTEELSEAEKKFDKQFHDWEAQFQKWKQQNANHPDKEQYREYEKKWETWRSQLLDRREQMKRKRLGLSNTLSQLTGDKPQKKVELDRPLNAQLIQQQPLLQTPNPLDVANSGMQMEANKLSDVANQATPEPSQSGASKPLNVGFLRPPPTLNNQPLEFKKANESFGVEPQNENKDGASCDFLKSSISGGIPGLDLVKDAIEPESTKEEVPVTVENPKPDLEAISRGINSILGDQKLLNMLSLVSQNRPLAPTVAPPKVDSPKFSPTDYNHPEEYDYESEHLRFEQLDEANSNTFEPPSHSDSHGKLKLEAVPEDPKGGIRNFSQFGNNERNAYNKNIDTHDNFNETSSNDFERESVHLKRDPPSFTKPLENFSVRLGDFNRGPPITAQGNSTSLRPTNDWNQDFQKGADYYRGPERPNDIFNRPPPNLNTLNRGAMPFNRDSGNTSYQNFEKHPKGNFGMGQNKFNQGGNAFNRNVSNFNEQGNFNRKLDNVPGNFNVGFNNFNEGKGFNKGGGLLGKEPPFARNPDFLPRVNTPNDDCNRFPNREFQAPGRNYQDNNSSNEDFNRRPDFNRMFTARDSVTNNNYNKDVVLEGMRRPLNTFGPGSEVFGKGGFNVQGNRTRGLPNVRNDNVPVSARNMEQPALEKDLNRVNQPFSNAHTPATVTQPDDPQFDGGIWKTKTVIDYDHKPLLGDDVEVILEPFYTFDYRHKPLNRIPYPSRPKWLSQIINKYPEFDLGRNSRPMEYRSYPTKNRFENPGYYKYEERGRKLYDDRNRRSLDDFDRDRKISDERGRKIPDEKERWGYDRGRKMHEDKDRRSYDDRDRKFNEEKEGNLRFDSSCGDHDEQRLHDKKDKLFDSNFDDFDDDFEIKDKSDDQNVEDNIVCIRNTEQVANTPASKSNVLLIEDILSPPGRFSRPPRIVIILRGPPGSGKSFLAKLIKDKEVENGGSAPRILCLDDYFMVEQEREVEEDGRRIKVKEMVYEYEEEMEGIYRQSLMKSFKKTITDGYFNFIIVDNINDKVKYFGEMWSFAKQNGFQVYICQMELDVQICTKRNIHGRSESEIEKCVAGWEDTPSHHPILDATSLIQSGSISEVEMEEINSPSSENMNEEERLIASKWDNFDYSIDNLAKLDGTNKPLRPNRTMEDYLQLDDDWIQPVSSKPGQKRVRWADLEERKQQEKMRAIGFVVGQTNWDRMMDPTMGSSALTQTKYIERYSKY